MRPAAAHNGADWSRNLIPQGFAVMRTILSAFVLGSLFLAAVASAQQPPAGNPLNEPLGDPGVVPTGADGKPLNLNFETGTLDGWKAEGKAFEGQPIKGDISRAAAGGRQEVRAHRPVLDRRLREAARPADGHAHQSPRSRSRTLTPAFSSAAAAAGRRASISSTADDNRVFYGATGKDQENLRPVIVDLQPIKGKKIFIRIVDQDTGGWGHVNFDDFRFHSRAAAVQVARRRAARAGSDRPLSPRRPLRRRSRQGRWSCRRASRVQVAAAEPDVQQPIAMAIDDRGRIWIAEAYEYPRRAQGRQRPRPHPDLRRHRPRRHARQADRLLRRAEPRQRPGSRLRRRLGRRRPVSAISFPTKTATTSPTPSRRSCSTAGATKTRTKRSTASSGAPTAGSTAATASSRTARSASRARPTTSACRSTPASGAITPCGTSSRSSPTAPATPGASTSTSTATSSPPPASSRTCFTSFPAPATSGRPASTSTPTPTTTSRRSPTTATTPATSGTTATACQSDTLGGGHAHAGCMIYQGGAWPEKYRGQLFMNNIHGNRHERRSARARTAAASSATTARTSCSPATSGRRCST